MHLDLLTGVASGKRPILFYTPVLLEEEKFLIILIFIKIKKLAEHQTSEETDLRQCWQGRWR